MLHSDVIPENISIKSAQHAIPEEESIVDFDQAKTSYSKPQFPEQKTYRYIQNYRQKRKDDSLSEYIDDDYEDQEQQHFKYKPKTDRDLPIPKLTGKNIKRWLHIYELKANCNNWDDETKFNHLIECFDDTAHLDYFLSLLNNGTVYDWNSAVQTFLKRYHIDEKPNLSAILIKQRPNESAHDYIMKFEANSVNHNIPEDTRVGLIISNLKPELQRFSSVKIYPTKATTTEKRGNKTKTSYY